MSEAADRENRKNTRADTYSKISPTKRRKDREIEAEGDRTEGTDNRGITCGNKMDWLILILDVQRPVNGEDGIRTKEDSTYHKSIFCTCRLTFKENLYFSCSACYEVQPLLRIQ